MDRSQVNDGEYINLVFNIPLLMDKIVKYSVHKSNGKKIDQQTTAELRLVNKTWLQCVSRILKASDYPAIFLHPGSPLPTSHERVFKTEINLEQFSLDFCKTSCFPNSILPTGLLIEQNYLVNRNRNNLRILFEKCGDLIRTLYVNFPIEKQYDEWVPIECTTLSFPILKQFKFQFETYRNMLSFKPRNSRWASCANGLSFLKLLLHNSKKLEHFSLINVRDSPVNVGFIGLPEALKGVALSPLLTDTEVTLLMKNNLPNLTHLNLTIGEHDEVPRLRKILERFGNQLTVLLLTVNKVDDDEVGEEEVYLPIFIDFPLLEKLQFLSLSGEDFDLLPQFRENWPKLVPNLTRLDFEDIQVKEESIVLNWIQGLRFENVTKFKFLPSDTEVVESPSEQMIAEIITSFPNIQKLTLKFNFCETSGLKYLFQNFTHLEELHLNFEFDELDGSTGCKVVSLFLGITLELATALVNDTKNTVNVPSDNRESIMNLQELRSLTLWTEIEGGRGFSNNTLCSEVFSRYGLEKMPKLETVKLLGGFKI